MKPNMLRLEWGDKAGWPCSIRYYADTAADVAAVLAELPPRQLAELAAVVWPDDESDAKTCPYCSSDRVRFIPGQGGGVWACADCHETWPDESEE